MSKKITKIDQIYEEIKVEYEEINYVHQEPKNEQGYGSIPRSGNTFIFKMHFRK
jgi:hypothetical protein